MDNIIQSSNNLNYYYQNAIFGVGILVIILWLLGCCFSNPGCCVFSELEAALSSLVLQGCLFFFSLFTLSFCYVFSLACNAEQDKCYVTLTV